MHADDDPLAALFLADDPQAVLRAASLVEPRSHGRVRKPETINRRTGKPERDGLFCAKIFGPVADLQCNCGRLSGPQFADQVCERCGVLCGAARLRGERWAHIESAAPLVHPVLAPAVARALGCTTKQLQALLAFEARLNDAGAVVQLDELGPEFGRGVWAIAERLGGRADELLLTRVPVTPPLWRGTRSDPQDAAYLQMINRCNRLDRLIELSAPEIILNNEARMAQMAFEKLYAAVRAELAVRGPIVVAPVDERSAELLAAVYDDPDDNAPRRAYAAHLAAHGDPRGEFIKLQLTSVTGGRRGADLLRRNFDRWLAPLDATCMSEVVFRRGFPSACKVTAAAEDAKIGDPAWATLEHLDSELVALICDPVLRGLRSLALGFKAMQALCEDSCVLPRVTTLVLRLTRCPPLQAETVTRCDALPGLHTLTLVHRSSRGGQDWRWLNNTPLARQLERLTLLVAFDRIDGLGLQWWIEFMQRHPRLTRLDIKLGPRHLLLELRRDGDWMTLRVVVPTIVLEYLCLGNGEMVEQIGRALTAVDPHSVALTVDCRHRWWGDELANLARRLREHFGAHTKLPALG